MLNLCVLLCNLMEEKSIYNIIESCKTGDRGAQKKLYDSLAPRMFSVCLRYCGKDRQMAEDLLQDGFITLFSKLDSFKGEGSFEGWARKIFVNTALMELRRKDVLKFSDELEEIRGMESQTPTIIEEISYQELMAKLAEMPTGFRTVFNMYIVEGYSHKEIAETLGIGEVSSRSQLARARNWLQERLKHKNEM